MRGMAKSKKNDYCISHELIIQGKGKNWFVIHLGNANDTAPNLSYRNFIHLHEHIISCMKCFN